MRRGRGGRSGWGGGERRGCDEDEGCDRLGGGRMGDWVDDGVGDDGEGASHVPVRTHFDRFHVTFLSLDQRR